MNDKASIENLYSAILKLETIDECHRFFNDLCTISELGAMAQRLLVAELLDENEVYSEIAKQTGASSATISRVARCLNHGADGYTMMLKRIKSN